MLIKIIALPLVVFETFGFLLLVFLLHLKQYDNIMSFIILVYLNYLHLTNQNT